MARRKQLEHFTEEELDQLFHGPALNGLDRVVRLNLAVPSPTPSPPINSSDTSTPSDLSTPGDVSIPSNERSPSVGHDSDTNHEENKRFATANGSAPDVDTSPGDIITPDVCISPGDETSSAHSTRLERKPPIPFNAQRQFASSQPIYKNGAGDYVDPKRVRRATLVQHGHSPTEQLIYQILWGLGGNRGERDVYRDVQIGYDKIARHSGISKRNIISIMHRLQEKLAIEVRQEQDSARNLAKQYRVYGMLQILDRRRQAGLEFVVRHKGVDFVFLESANTSPGVVSSPGDASSSDDRAASGRGDVPSPGSDDASTPEPGDTSSPLLGTTRKNGGNRSSLEAIARALRTHIGHSDDDAVHRIEVACREKCPDVTEAEIVHFIEEHGQRFARMKTLDNPMGMLIRHLPKCFEGESFQLYRRSEALKREELRKTWQCILDDPDTDAETKRLAQSWLASEGL